MIVYGKGNAAGTSHSFGKRLLLRQSAGAFIISPPSFGDAAGTALVGGGSESGRLQIGVNISVPVVQSALSEEGGYTGHAGFYHG